MLRLHDIKADSAYIVVRRCGEHNSCRVGVGERGVMKCLADHLVELLHEGFYDEYLDTETIERKEDESLALQREHWDSAHKLEDEYRRMVAAGLTEDRFVSLREMRNWIEAEKETAQNLDNVIADLRSTRATGQVLSEITQNFRDGTLDLDKPLTSDVITSFLPTDTKSTVGMFTYYFLASRIRNGSERIEIVESEIYR